MSEKKSAKTLLEYDPLSWLKEDNTEKPVAAKKKSTARKSVKAAKPKANTSSKKKSVSNKKPVKAVNPRSNASKSVTCSSEVLNLGSELTIKNVADFKKQIEASLAGDSDIRLDPGELQKIDTSGLQLLYSLQKTLAKSSQQLHWVSRNSVLDSAAELVGMNELINAITDSPEQDQGFGFF